MTGSTPSSASNPHGDANPAAVAGIAASASSSEAGSPGGGQSDAPSGPGPAPTERAAQTRERSDDGRRPSDEPPPGSTAAGQSQRLDAVASPGRRLDGPTTSELAGTVATGTTATETAVADVEHLLDRVVHQIRTLGTSSDPALEARLQDPELGSVRVLVAGRTGEIVRAEVFVADQSIADALTRAVDRTATSHGLAGIDLRIRTEPGRPGGSAAGSGSGSDGGRPEADQRGWAGPNNGFERGLDQGRHEAQNNPSGPRSPSQALRVPAIAATRRSLPTAGSLDVRA
jgi:hypothetical protein